MQVGEKEREHDITSLKKELATLVAEKCVDPSTQRPYPVGMIEKAMTEAGYSIKTNKTAKSQVGRAELLSDTGLIPSKGFGVHQGASDVVESADTTCSDAGAGHCTDEGRETIAGTDIGRSRAGGRRRDGPDRVGGGESDWFRGLLEPTYAQQVMLIDPGQFRVINELLQKKCKGKGKLETLTFAATAESQTN